MPVTHHYSTGALRPSNPRQNARCAGRNEGGQCTRSPIRRVTFGLEARLADPALRQRFQAIVEPPTGHDQRAKVRPIAGRRDSSVTVSVTGASLTMSITKPYPRPMDYRDRITIEPGKRGGKPCIRGLRITVYEVLDYLASGMTEAEIVRDFPDLTPEDIRACLAFAADRERKLASAPPA